MAQAEIAAAEAYPMRAIQSPLDFHLRTAKTRPNFFAATKPGRFVDLPRICNLRYPPKPVWFGTEPQQFLKSPHSKLTRQDGPENEGTAIRRIACDGRFDHVCDERGR